MQQIEMQFGQDHQLFQLSKLPLHSQLFPDGARPISVRAIDSKRIQPEQRGKFWLDFIPRPIMAAGPMVDLLVRSNVGHYIDFRALDGLYAEFGNPDGLQYVPGSRADVFQNRFITMLEKRLLMRFVKTCYEGNENLENGDGTEEGGGSPGVVAVDEESRSFKEEMSAMGLTEKLQQFLVHSIVLATGNDDSLSSGYGVGAVKKYQQSMMKFGTKTPFLYANHGSGELSQAFCRLCAVHGGVYVLRRGATSVIQTSDSRQNGGNAVAGETSGSGTMVGIVTAEKELIKCKNAFVSKQLAGAMDLGMPTNLQVDDAKVWRLMAIVDGSIVRDPAAKRIMVTVPRGNSGNDTSAVRIRQLDDAVMICPPGYFVLYAETLESDGSEQDVLSACRRYVEMGTNNGDMATDGGSTPHLAAEVSADERDPQSCESDNRPRVLWGVTYSRTLDNQRVAGKGVVLVSQLDHGHDTDDAIAEAKRCFGMVHPVEEFFRMPSPGIESDIDDQSPETATASEAEPGGTAR